MQEVAILRTPISQLEPLIGASRVDALRAVGQSLRAQMDRRTLWHINSTAVGGGVAEMLSVLLGFAADGGIAIRWLVIDGDPQFFRFTKQLHSALHGAEPDVWMSEEDTAHYRGVTAANSSELAGRIRPGDVVVLHDPQTAGLAPGLAARGAHVIWRCHIGADFRNAGTDRAWGFLRGFIEPSIGVFSRRAYAPEWMPADDVVVIPPSIDPLSPKNQPLGTTTIASILAWIGIIADGDVSDDRSFTRRDGLKGAVARRAVIDRDGPPPAIDVPLVVQVSRWDPLKDMRGVLDAFALVGRDTDAHLALVGPAVTSVSDDPTAAAEYESCRRRWDALPNDLRRRIQLVRLPMDDPDENAAMVNALQRHATVVVQKSKAEGFGLTVTEAMWKERAPLASRVGGIVDQIDAETGVLVQPDDLAGCATALLSLLNDPGRRATLGGNARRRVHERYLPDTQLQRWAALVTRVIARAE